MVPAPCPFRRFNIPALTVVVPSYIFVPERINFPVPFFIKSFAAPLISPDKLNVPSTLIDAIPGKIKGQVIVAVPERIVITTPAFPAIVND